MTLLGMTFHTQRSYRYTCNNCTIMINACNSSSSDRTSELPLVGNTRAWDVHVEMAVMRSWGFPGAHDHYSSATVCHTAGVRSPCAEVRRIDNLFTISARARTSTRVRWRTAVIYAVTRNNSSAENREKIRKSLIILACLGKNEKSLSCYFCHVLFSFILVIVINLNRV